VRCCICFKFQHVAQMFSNKKGQLPAFCTDLGTVPRKEVLDSHLASQMHAECVNMEMAEQLKNAEICTGPGAQTCNQNDVKHLFSTKHAELAGKMCRCFYTVYNDAKCTTLSAWSWPSHEVAHLLGCNAEQALSRGAGSDNVSEITTCSLQYLIPQAHADLLDSILTADNV